MWRVFCNLKWQWTTSLWVAHQCFFPQGHRDNCSFKQRKKKISKVEKGIWRFRSQSLKEEWKGTKPQVLRSFHSLWLFWDAMLCQCSCWSVVFVKPKVHQEIMLSSDKSYGDPSDFLFQQHLAPACTAKTPNRYSDCPITLLHFFQLILGN